MQRSAGLHISFWPEFAVEIKVNMDVGHGYAIFIAGDEVGNCQ